MTMMTIGCNDHLDKFLQRHGVLAIIGGLLRLEGFFRCWSVFFAILTCLGVIFLDRILHSCCLVDGLNQSAADVYVWIYQQVISGFVTKLSVDLSTSYNWICYKISKAFVTHLV